WGSSAVDPTKGTMYIVSKELPTFIKLNEPGARGAGRGAGGGRGGQGAGAGGGAAPAGARGPAPPRAYRPEGFIEYAAPYDFMTSGTTTDGVGALSIMGPPWSQLTAYDLNTGKILWRVPHGSVTALGDTGKNVGSIAPRGGVVVTAGGFILAGS